MTRKIFYHELSWPEVKDAVKEGKIPILPVGSIEQHGPHLPLTTDAFIVFSICVKAAEASGELLVMPPYIMVVAPTIWISPELFL
ncbi:MAG: creatininase family protein [Candidatus Bathyarchaeia archaeon]